MAHRRWSTNGHHVRSVVGGGEFQMVDNSTKGCEVSTTNGCLGIVISRRKSTAKVPRNYRNHTTLVSGNDVIHTSISILTESVHDCDE